jgi:hypothetical protein
MARQREEGEEEEDKESEKLNTQKLCTECSTDWRSLE